MLARFTFGSRRTVCTSTKADGIGQLWGHRAAVRGWPFDVGILAVMGREVGAEPGPGLTRPGSVGGLAAAEQNRQLPTSEVPHGGGVEGTRVMATVGYRLVCLERV